MSDGVEVFLGLTFIVGLYFYYNGWERLEIKLEQFKLYRGFKTAIAILCFLSFLGLILGLIAEQLSGITTRILSDHPILFLLLISYLSGVLLVFILTAGAMIWRLLTRNSIRNQNLWLVGQEVTWMGGIIVDKDPGKKTFVEELRLLPIGLILMAFNAVFMSWIGVLLSLIATIHSVYKHFSTPANIREISWRAGNIAYRRVEDYLKVLQDSYLVGSTDLSEQMLSEAKAKTENLTRRYAEVIYPDNPDKVEEYLKLARARSLELFKSEAIHPTFWAIPATKPAMHEALGVYSW